MNDLTSIFGDFSLSDGKHDYINYKYFDFFKNPNKLPINNVFLETVRHELDKKLLGQWKLVSKKDKKIHVTTTREVLPALHNSWLPEYIPTFEYQEYIFGVSEKENSWFLENNKNYLLFLEYLIRCTYHQFWCSILFKEEVQNSLRDFLLHPIPIYLYKELGDQFQKLYKAIFNAFYMVIRRLIFFNQSETEYMDKSVGTTFLIERNLLSLPIVTTIALLYQDFDDALIDELGEIYFTCNGQKKYIQKEVEHILNHSIVVLEMIKGKLTGKFDPGIKVVPISLDDRPKVFSLYWIDSVVNYCLNAICTLNALFRLRNSTIQVAFTQNIPEKLAKYYDIIFNELYDLLDDREEIDENVSQGVFSKIGYARSKFVDTFHSFIAHILDKTILMQGEPKHQQEYFELFISSMTAALEYEVFICDYDFKYSIFETIETLKDFAQIDNTRAEYVLTSLNNLERHDFIKAKFSFESGFLSSLPKQAEVISAGNYSDEAGPSCNQNDDLDNKIQSIMAIFPHLGDGFVEKCLEHYDYNTDQVVQAILEENLPPHILNMPFDFPRIPPEPEPPKPVLAYRGKKPGHKDALMLLNDKKEKEEMKTLILEGIKYNNRYDNLEDEYDDRDDLLEPDFVVEHEVEKYEKVNEEDLVSDTSYSDNEYDDDGKPVETTNKTNFKPFCENPEIVRARYEARFGRGRGRANVVGKPKGQGQEKSVVNARQKKNVQKSSRANHNRKGGSQFKRNRGMIPS